MTNDLLSTLSNGFADVADRASASVVQVHGRRRPASGVVYAKDVVIAMASTLGGDDALHVRGSDGDKRPAVLAGWDPASGLAVLKAPGLGAPPVTIATTAARVGHISIALARSWSNALTVSAGVVAVIGGPLPTGRRRALEQVIRTTAPMHDGFAGGALLDVNGSLIGVTTAARIRGLSVVIPASIAWATAAALLEHGTPRRPFLGIAAQPIQVPDWQQPGETQREALLVVGVTAGSPAATSGVLVGDVLLQFDGQPVQAPEELLDLLGRKRAGDRVAIRLLRGGQPTEIAVVVGERNG